MSVQDRTSIANRLLAIEGVLLELLELHLTALPAGERSRIRDGIKANIDAAAKELIDYAPAHQRQVAEGIGAGAARIADDYVTMALAQLGEKA
jgi:hypothetical protein